jgi:hypothetical protein
MFRLQNDEILADPAVNCKVECDSCAHCHKRHNVWSWNRLESRLQLASGIVSTSAVAGEPAPEKLDSKLNLIHSGCASLPDRVNLPGLLAGLFRH